MARKQTEASEEPANNRSSERFRSDIRVRKTVTHKKKLPEQGWGGSGMQTKDLNKICSHEATRFFSLCSLHVKGSLKLKRGTANVPREKFRLNRDPDRLPKKAPESMLGLSNSRSKPDNKTLAHFPIRMIMDKKILKMQGWNNLMYRQSQWKSFEKYSIRSALRCVKLIVNSPLSHQFCVTSDFDNISIADNGYAIGWLYSRKSVSDNNTSTTFSSCI